ncbi:unnamed protein product [Amoebophrya sp. A120]|nr:unnamed protein product [Amoebophrya sp. A120]|eukprot:GSA120T00003938001.1
MPVTILGSKQRVVDLPGQLSIDEFAGNVATKDDRISIASVAAKAGTAEPWLTLLYDEWICVLKGEIVFTFSPEGGGPEGDVVRCPAGSTAFISKSTRFQPQFPVDTEYIPVCLPAFRPDRCLREDSSAENEKVSARLAELHDAAPADSKANSCQPTDSTAPPDILYHMTEVKLWQASKAKKEAYFPPTFEADGFYTHATAVPARLLETANHFYQDSTDDWVCLQFSRAKLRKEFGVITKDEPPMPVGEKKVAEDWQSSQWVCPHVYGGIPVAAVEKEFRMLRDDAKKKFLGIEGLV